MKVSSMATLLSVGEVIILLFAGSSVAAEPTWVPGPPMQTPRSGPGVTLGKDGLIYVIGGKAYGNTDAYTINTVERFNEATNRWAYIRPMTKKRVFAGAVTDSDGQIWAVGGHGPGEIYDTVEIYNPASDSWSTQQRKLKTRRTNHGIAIMSSGCIYVFGGTSEWSESGWLRSAEKYDPSTSTPKWNYVASMHEARAHPGVGIDEQGRIYACGGASWTEPLSTVERYDPETNEWEYVKPLPEPMGNPAGFTLNGEIWVVGGWQRGGGATYTSSCYIYSPITKSWRPGPRMFEPIGNTQAAVALSGTVYLVEGEATSIGPTDKIAMLNPATGWSFAIITDLHIGSGQGQWVLYPPPLGLVYDLSDYDGVTWNDSGTGPDHPASNYLKEAVALINDFKRVSGDLRFVVVTGDLTQSAELSEFGKAKSILDELDVPWVPLPGNHDTWPDTAFSEADPCDINMNGPDQYFNEVFAPQYQKFVTDLGLTQDTDWWKPEPRVWDLRLTPTRFSFFQNFAFEYENLFFVGLDFNCRGDDWASVAGWPPTGQIHNFTNQDKTLGSGSWPWFTEHLSAYTKAYLTRQEDVILFSHHPFRQWCKGICPIRIGYQMGFSDDDMTTIFGFLWDHRNRVRVQFAGHSHETADRPSRNDIMRIVETGANYDDSGRRKTPLVRTVRLSSDQPTNIYETFLPALGMVLTVASPVDLEVIDPNGLVIGKQINQIPNAIYFEEDTDGDGSPEDSVYIRERKPGDYKIRVIPEPNASPTATYSLELSMVEKSSGWAPITIAEDVPIEQTPTQPYSFTVKKREPARLNYIGDLSGEYRATLVLSASLTDVTHVNRLADKPILFNLGASSIQAVTDTNGIASVPLTLDQRPSEYYYVDVSFSGDARYVPATDSEPFTIAPPSVDGCVSIKVGGAGYDRQTNQFGVDVTIRNTSSKIIEIPLWLVVKSISDPNVSLADNDGVTPDGKAYTSLSNLLLDDGHLDPQESITKRIYFNNPRGVRFTFEPSVRGVILEQPSQGPLEQLSGLSTHWLGSEASLDVAPAGGDGIINFRDFARIAEGWLNKEE